MARRVNRLSGRTITGLVKAGYHGDGAGLYLQVSATGSKSWIFRYSRAGRSREMGLGSLHGTTLAQARTLAERCRQQVRDRLDPIEARKEERRATRLAEARSMTFAACARAYVDAHQAEWRNAKHREQWRSTLET